MTELEQAQTLNIRASRRGQLMADLPGPFGSGKHTRAAANGFLAGQSAGGGCGCLFLIAVIVFLVAVLNGFTMH
ncbi:hypothetical protein ACWCV9_23515 [Streptomyces sp. NPDC001606]